MADVATTMCTTRCEVVWASFLVASSALALPASDQSGSVAWGGGGHSRPFVRKLFKQLTPAVRREAALTWLSCSAAPLFIRQAVEDVFPEKRTGRLHRGTTFLITFIGPWPQMSSQDKRRPVSLPPLLDEVQRLRMEPGVLSLWASAMGHAHAMKLKLGSTAYAVCLEVCPYTFGKTGLLQLHVRLCIRSGHPMTLGSVADHFFREQCLACLIQLEACAPAGLARGGRLFLLHC